MLEEYFKTPTWIENHPQYLKNLNRHSNKYIKEARKYNKEIIKKTGDFGITHNSTTLLKDSNFLEFKKFVGKKCWDFLFSMGYDMNLYTTLFTELWVQEFAQKGGGHHSGHIHWNQHVSGFYFLKCSNKTSYPIFHDPRGSARMSKLKLRPDINSIVYGTEYVRQHIEPGTLIIFPGYIEHEFVVDHGVDPFRFIHFNVQAVPKEIVNV